MVQDWKWYIYNFIELFLQPLLVYFFYSAIFYYIVRLEKEKFKLWQKLSKNGKVAVYPNDLTEWRKNFISKSKTRIIFECFSFFLVLLYYFMQLIHWFFWHIESGGPQFFPDNHFLFFCYIHTCVFPTVLNLWNYYYFFNPNQNPGLFKKNSSEIIYTEDQRYYFLCISMLFALIWFNYTTVYYLRYSYLGGWFLYFVQWL